VEGIWEESKLPTFRRGEMPLLNHFHRSQVYRIPRSSVDLLYCDEDDVHSFYLAVTQVL